jgi:hypothetical protein
MSPLPQQADRDGGERETIESVPHALQSKAMPAGGVQDPEALDGIEMATVGDRSRQQKCDDLYLVCFDESYDAEK